jgi:hypothetical protein
MKKLNSDLYMRTVKSEHDKSAFIALSNKYNNASEGATCKCLINHYPNIQDEHFQIVEDTVKNRIVSTTCLIPWTINFEGVPLNAAMLEMVLTHPDYRGMGLVRDQIDCFHKTVQEQGNDMSFIWGIPYYYRQFGYSYAIEGLVAEYIPKVLIPADLDCDGLSLMEAKIKDIPILSRNYANLCESLDIYVERTEIHWQYMIEHARFPVYLVTDRQGHTHGYIVMQNDPANHCVNILENSLDDAAVALVLLAKLKKEAQGEIYIFWPGTSAMVKLAKSLGSTTIKNTQWLFRIHDICAFIIKIRKVLERRLDSAGLGGFNGSLVINFFKSAYEITISGGKITEVNGIGFKDASMGADGGDLCIPMDAFIQYIMGFRNLEELRDIWPDIVVRNKNRYILEALFRKSEAYLYTPYHYLGPIQI